MEAQRYSFALARFGRFLNRQMAELIIFDGDGILLHENEKIVRSIPWAEVQSIELVHTPLPKLPFANMLGGAFGGKNEFTFYVKAGNEEMEFILEQDANYRKGQIRDLLKMLREKGVDLQDNFVV